MQENFKKLHCDKDLTRTQFWAIIVKVKEGKLVAAADRRHLWAQTFIAGIAAEVENDQWETHLGSWGDDQTLSPTLNKDLKIS